MATPPTTSKRHPIWARFYARISPTMDAQGAPVPIRVVDGTADTLGAADASTDAAVASLVLCVVWPILMGGCHTAATPWPPSPPPDSGSRASSGSGFPRAGCRSPPRPTSSESPNRWQYDPDPAHASEIEVRFSADGPDQTTVTLEHRHLERLVDGQALRDGITGGGGWGALLKLFVKAATNQT